MNNENVFNVLNSINVNDKTEKKNGLTYLSWAWAWQEVKKQFPDATYSIYKNEQNLPFVYDENTGYMCYTSVTINGLTHEMWLPVMDGANHAMKAKPYNIKTKYKEIPVEARTMFDINKTVMRCLTKNLAMFGLGLYIYAGEDLPETEQTDNVPEPPKKEKKAKPKNQTVYACEECGTLFEDVLKDGVLYTAQFQSDNALKYRGRRICKDCFDKRKLKSDEANIANEFLNG